MNEMREKIERTLAHEETEDLHPPYRSLPPGHPVWIKFKADAILALPSGVRKKCPECGGIGYYETEYGPPYKRDCPDCHGEKTIPIPLSDLESECEARGKRVEELEKLYHELLYAVGNKYPKETRHETALRYIKQAEIGKQEAAPALSGEKGKG